MFKTGTCGRWKGPFNNHCWLISLCRSCHCKTNFSRSDWIDLFKKRLSEEYGYSYDGMIERGECVLVGVAVS